MSTKNLVDTAADTITTSTKDHVDTAACAQQWIFCNNYTSLCVIERERERERELSKRTISIPDFSPSQIQKTSVEKQQIQIQIQIQISPQKNATAIEVILKSRPPDTSGVV